jgi:hypothetical protein
LKLFCDEPNKDICIYKLSDASERPNDFLQKNNG